MTTEKKILRSHFNAIENSLIAIGQIPANSGHPLHKGTPREAFIKEFLTKHISETVAIGTGEIIHYSSTTDEIRNQLDIIVYRRDYPKLDYGGGINAYLADSVVATIEVKSELDKDGLRQAVKAAKKLKVLSFTTISHYKSIESNTFPLGILNYLVAYRGPSDMRTVYNWLEQIHLEEGLLTTSERGIVSPSLDTIIVLGKGFVHFDNMPLRFTSDEPLDAHPGVNWAISNSPDENLLLLFLSLTGAIVNGKPSNELSVLYYATDIFSRKEIYCGT